MDANQRRARAHGGVGWLLLVMAFVTAVTAPASASPPEGTGEEAEEQAESAHHLTLGARGILGAGFVEGDTVTAPGAGITAAVPILHERWELELGVSLLRPDEWLGAVEIVAKRLFELDTRLHPHVIIGPLLSLELEGRESSISAGLIAGAGLSYRLDARWGVTFDASYRLLAESEVLHVVTGAAGISLRL